VSTVTHLIRDKPEPRLTGGPLPANILPSIVWWIRERLWLDTPMGIQLDHELMGVLERNLGVAVPFASGTDNVILADLEHRVSVSEDFAIATLAIMLPVSTWGNDTAELAKIFEAPGSKWELIVVDSEGKLTPRQTGPVAEVISGFASYAAPAGEHLRKSLEKLGSDEPGVAYLEAVKAVEAAARPVVLPNDAGATLGKIIGTLKSEPQKYGVVLPVETVDDVIRRAEILWKTPHERHGSDDPQPPVTAEHAQAGFAIALGLVDYFGRGLIHRIDS
jgi:hypothetical protein